MTISLNAQDLLQLLQKHRLQPIVESHSEQIYITMTIEKIDIPLFFIISSDKMLLQLIAYFPFPLNESKISSLARLLHQFNRDIDLPGFGLDLKEKLIFYRLVIPCFEGVVHEQLLANYIGAVRIACESFLTPIGLVAIGGGGD